jgi:hypothetical protein
MLLKGRRKPAFFICLKGYGFPFFGCEDFLDFTYDAICHLANH